MARILFVVNDEPHEAFAISAARETAKELQAQGFKILRIGKDAIPKKPDGNEIIWGKIKPEETFLGAILKSKEGKKFSDTELAKQDKHFDKIVQLGAKYAPLIVYTFHCTPAEKEYWKESSRVDFTISQEYIEPVQNLRVVEVKAIYKSMPQRILRKLSEKTRYFDSARKESRTTSSIETIKAGLRPKEFGKAIAKAINLEIKRESKKKYRWMTHPLLKAQRHRIKRIYGNPHNLVHNLPRRI